MDEGSEVFGRAKWYSHLAGQFYALLFIYFLNAFVPAALPVYAGYKTRAYSTSSSFHVLRVLR